MAIFQGIFHRRHARRAQAVFNVNQFSGDDAGVKISACIAALPAKGGTCDARGLVGAQFAHAPLSTDKPVTLLLGHVNLTLLGNPGIALASSGIHIEGSGSTLSQLTYGFVESDIISNVAGGYCPSGTTEATRISNFEVDHLKFQGIPGAVSACPNNGVDILDGSGISVHGNLFTGLGRKGRALRTARM